ncbi:MAG: hypothetical protein AAGG01_22690, partial [Planctomycetota bacterium]
MSGEIDKVATLLASLRLPPSSGFRWASDHAAIERITDGRTVAFRPEVERVVLDLADEGLTARMESVAEAFLAVRDLPVEALKLLDPTAGQDPFFVGHVVVHLLERCRERLDTRHHAIVAEGLACGWPLGADLGYEAPGVRSAELPDVRAAIPFIDEAVLRTRVLTRSERELPPPRLDPISGGSDGKVPWEQVGAAPQRPPVSEFEAISRMARTLVAAVRLPLPGATPKDVAVGGVADIANRGSLERLLISELGHDDEVLAARLVLGEALFLQRESASRPRAPERHVLVDASIRAWGTTRLVQAAAALAVLRGAPPDISCAMWVARSGSLERVDDASDEALALGLSELGSAPSLASVLQEFDEKTRALDADVVPERV